MGPGHESLQQPGKSGLDFMWKRMGAMVTFHQAVMCQKPLSWNASSSSVQGEPPAGHWSPRGQVQSCGGDDLPQKLTKDQNEEWRQKVESHRSQGLNECL